MHAASVELRILFGAKLRRARRKAKLTQDRVAAQAATTQPSVSDVENGVQNITLETVSILADAVGVGVKNLLSRPRRRAP